MQDIRRADARTRGATIVAPGPARLPRRCEPWRRATFRACCSKAARSCTLPRGTPTSSTTSSCMLRRCGSVPAAYRCLVAVDVSTASLLERQVELLGPDVLIEGYVHRPH